MDDNFENLKIMVIDDSKTIRRTAETLLKKVGCEVITATDGFDALAKIADSQPNIIFVDIMMPRLDGYQTCALIKNNSSFKKTPVIMLSSKDGLFDKAKGRIVGSDQYLTKPFSPRELVARIKAMLRRVQRLSAPAPSTRDALDHGPLTLDLVRHKAFWQGVEVVFTVTEFNLLSALMGRPGRVYTRDDLVDRVWAPGHAITDRTIDSHIRRIRRKLGQAGAEAIETVYGLGYRLKEDL